ncbi:hypothetical protein DMB44_08905 [Thermoplasma sp. Kam2015]|nr:hypothetical protein DMB44_08905 [Thermoplasma sp. Kam2015]
MSFPSSSIIPSCYDRILDALEWLKGYGSDATRQASHGPYLLQGESDHSVKVGLDEQIAIAFMLLQCPDPALFHRGLFMALYRFGAYMDKYNYEK